jgi:phosphoglycolate phosphatase-like HAD superfamily hydrolase
VNKRLLITDVDNTLFDWQEVWYQTFSAMVGQVLSISGVDEERLYAECSAIHQKYGTSEYSQILGELPCLQELYGDEIYDHMAPAIDAFRAARRDSLRLYPGVLETLEILNRQGVVIAAFTESKAFYTNYRFRKLGLDGPISYIYSPHDHEMKPDVASIRRYDPDHYEFKQAIHRFTPDGEVKPNPHILNTIVEELGFRDDETVYLGDNVLKDVYMAQQAGITDVYAAYGASQHRPEYELLRKVTHWTPEMVERERAALKPGAITPTHTLSTGFHEILPLFEAV